MRKLKLDLDELQVDSFTTATAREFVGTVKGHETELLGCSMYCGTAEGTCAVQSCQYSQCVAGDTCGCGLSNIGSCAYQVTCGGGQCGGLGGHSGGWCSEYCFSGPTCDPEVCGVYTGGGC